MIQVLPLISE